MHFISRTGGGNSANSGDRNAETLTFVLDSLQQLWTKKRQAQDAQYRDSPFKINATWVFNVIFIYLYYNIITRFIIVVVLFKLWIGKKLGHKSPSLRAK